MQVTAALLCFVLAFALGVASYWVGKLLGPAVALLALGHVLAGR
jgi:hypothetical protein